jgi:hypothetical protein
MSVSSRTILSILSLERLRTLARDFNAAHLWPMTKAAAIENLEQCANVPEVLEHLSFEELTKVCRKLHIEDRAHRREVLVARVLDAVEVPVSPAA